MSDDTSVLEILIAGRGLTPCGTWTVIDTTTFNTYILGPPLDQRTGLFKRQSSPSNGPRYLFDTQNGQGGGQGIGGISNLNLIKRWIINDNAFNTYDFNNNNVISYPDALVNSIPSGLPNIVGVQ